ncbi:MAG: DUF4976 domain-containing protein [Bacteroidetes bacterium]|nr:MAG: DUF4976 domain-containing protein [Bacteroidota bacterium]
MNQRISISRPIRAAGWISLLVFLSSCQPPARTNVVLLIVDDLGWADTGVYGSSFYETPNIDELAERGIRFINFYAASPVCSPTRASIMTGKHPARVKITNWIGGEQKGQLLQATYGRHLPLEEVTFAERFQAAGYTTAFLGKWHLGSDGYLPEDQGFDLNIGGHDAGQPGSYFYPYEHPNNDYWDVPGLGGGKKGEYLTDRLTDESIAFIKDHVDDPFLLVLSYYNVHTPLQAKEELIEKYKQKAASLKPCADESFTPESDRSVTRRCQDHPVYAAMVQSTDESLGRIRAELERLGISDRTAIVFVSDNGGLSTLSAGRMSMPTSNHPLRAGKGWLYEGGIRVPFMILWPGMTEPGAVRYSPATTMDIAPTIEEMAGLPPRELSARDGVSLVALVKSDSNDVNRSLFWHFPHYHGSGNRPSGAVLDGRYKLVEWLEDGSLELFDLESDPSELNNIALFEPSTTERLRQLLHDWREGVDAEMPTPNPDWLVE